MVLAFVKRSKLKHAQSSTAERSPSPSPDPGRSKLLDESPSSPSDKLPKRPEML